MSNRKTRKQKILAQKREEIRIVKGGELLTVQTQNNALDILLEPGEAVWILGL